MAVSHMLKLVGALAALSIVAAACGGDSSAQGSNLGGDLTISGSSTVQPITSRVAELFQQQNPNVSISVDGPGTTDGFALFCKGDTQISDASRPIDPAEEMPVCKKNGIDFIELKIGIDGLTMMTNPANKAISCLDFKDIYALLGPESEGFETWSDANKLGEEIGAGHVPYPNVPLDIVGPGEESGTWGSLIDLVIKDIAEARGLPDAKAETTRPDYNSSGNDNIIIRGVEGSDTSLGWVGFAYAQQAGSGIKELQVAESDDKCVPPTDQTIATKKYPLSRDLFIYVNAKDAKRDPAVAAFVDFYLGDGFSSVQEVGYVNEPQDVIANTKQTWRNRTTGTQES